jgi:exonuclease SbcD
MKLETVTYPAPVIRYSGSALHVSCDETYPHTVSVVEIDHHGGQVSIRQRRINELRHFYVLPETADTAFTSEQMALKAVEDRCKIKESCYIRLKINNDVDLSSDFTKQVEDLLKENGDHVRYNPRILWVGQDTSKQVESEKPVFELTELQQMTDPIVFIERTRDMYPKLDFSTLRQVFDEIEEEIKRIHEAEVNKKAAKS